MFDQNLNKREKKETIILNKVGFRMYRYYIKILLLLYK